MRSQNLYCKLVQNATADPFTALAAAISADPHVRAIRLALYARRNRACLVTIRARAHSPPPAPRCHRPQAYRADSSNGEDATCH
jgi:hypothetical protein